MSNNALPATRLVNLETAAEWLGGLSVWTLRKWIQEGKIRDTCLIGSRRMIPISEVERLIQEGRAAAMKARA